MITVDLVERMLPGHLVQHYLLASFCYYHQSESPMTDDAFDRLCVRLLALLPNIQHPHKHIINPGDLEAGSCFLDRDKFPNIVKISAIEYAIESRTRKLWLRLDAVLPPLAARPQRVMRRPIPSAPVASPQPARPVARVVRRPAPQQAAPPAPARRIVRSAVKK